ncbi:MAG: hypothetical protein M3O50_08215 [Myxococcota bacterium]|nr:hypothetical protein [Myxococcota bacterium]
MAIQISNQTQIDTVEDGRYRAPLQRFFENVRMAKPSRDVSGPQNRRGSPEAIEKRRVARLFNEILGGRRHGTHNRDGRTEKRRQRLLSELEAGKTRGSRELKPLDVLQRVNELMHLGEPLGSIRKVAKVRKSALPLDAVVAVVTRLHKAYGFRAECYRFVGVSDDVLRSAGVLTGERLRKAHVRKRAA